MNFQQEIKPIIVDYFLFKLNKEHYCFKVQNIERIIPIPIIRKVPNLPTYVLGIIDYEEQIIPIINIKINMRLEDNESEGKFIVLVERKGYLFGIIADDILELKEFKTEPRPDNSLLSAQVEVFSDGIFRLNESDDDIDSDLEDELIIVLNVKKIHDVIEKELT